MLKLRPKFWIWPYNGKSQAARLLAKALGGRLIRRVGSKYKYQVRDCVINWGCTASLPNVPMLNRPGSVKKAASKMETFRVLSEAGIPIPPWTQDRALACEWNQKGKLLGRDLDRGSRGRGITVYFKGEEPKEHLFYVRYMKKEREFRVHVFNGTVIFVQEKLKKKGVEDANPFIRSHHNGWCFAFHHLDEQPPAPNVLAVGVASVGALGLNFGAVDVAWSERTGATVLEVNTAPGIEETSLGEYADAFQRNL